MNRLRLVVVLLLVCLGCERASSPPTTPGFAYFPLATGQTWEYEVTETTYALNQLPQTRTYQLRETTGAKYTDASGQDVYPITRAIKSPQGDWISDSIFIAWRTLDQALRSENGGTYVKIQFPVSEHSRWNGNLLNTRPEQLYEIASLDKTRQIGNTIYDKTLTVVQQNDSTLLSLRRSQEIYAEGVGLVQRERTFVQYCSTPACIGQGTIDYGFSQLSTLTNYTK